MTCRLCERLHCTKGFTEYCTICAYLHDIGKQFIPQAILQKPSKLTDEEFEIMKTHTTIGYKICMNDLKLRPYAAGPIYHHEALNGTGYPKGLTKRISLMRGKLLGLLMNMMLLLVKGNIRVILVLLILLKF